MIPKKIRRIGSRLSNLSTKHKFIVGASVVGAGMGMNAADPLKPAVKEAQEALFSDPNAVEAVVRAEASYNFNKSHYQTDALGRLRNPTQFRNPSPYTTNASGAIVFGAYNMRRG